MDHHVAPDGQMSLDDSLSIGREEIVYSEQHVDVDQQDLARLDILAAVSLQASCMDLNRMDCDVSAPTSLLQAPQDVVIPACSPTRVENVSIDELICQENGTANDIDDGTNFYEGPKDLYDFKTEIKQQFESRNAESLLNEQKTTAPLLVNQHSVRRKAKRPSKYCAPTNADTSVSSKIFCVPDPESLSQILDISDEPAAGPHQPPEDVREVDDRSSSSSYLSDDDADNIFSEFGIKLPRRPVERHSTSAPNAEKILIPTTTTMDCTYFRGTFFQKGDIVSLVDTEDDCFYFAQITGLMQDQFCEKSASLDWLVPTRLTSRDFFDPSAYKIGFRETQPRKLECMSFVCHAPFDYYTREQQFQGENSQATSESNPRSRETSVGNADISLPNTDQTPFIWTSLKVCEVSRPVRIND